MNVKLLSALLLALLLALGGCSRGGEQVTDSGPAAPAPAPSQPTQAASLDILHVPYTPGDSLNPYTTRSIYNFYAAQLLFDPLVRLDSAYKPTNCLADDILLAGTTCTITLRSGVTFTDGTPLTSADVGYSLSLAMQSGYFGSGLTNILQVEEVSDLTLVLSLAYPDQFLASSLCFPIVKNGTGAEALPVGSGRYVQNGSSLTPNPAYFEAAGQVKTVTLVEQSSADALGYALKNGTIDYLFSDLREKWHTNQASSYQMVQLNNLVYVGVNANSWPTSDPDLVKILFDLLPRDGAVGQVYGGNAIGTWLPFNPTFYGADAYRPASTPSLELVGEQLDALGYNLRDTAGYRTSSQGSRLSATVLCVSDNDYREDLAKVLAAACTEAGIELAVESVPYADYLERLQSGAYDLYIGEVKLPYNMDIAPLLPGGYLAYGARANAALDEAYTAFRSGEGSFEDFRQAFLDRPPFIPLLYRRGLVSFSFNFTANIVATEQDIFYNVLDW